MLVQNPIVLAILWLGVAVRGFWVSWAEGLAILLHISNDSG